MTYAARRALIGSRAADPALIHRALAQPRYDVSGGVEGAYVPVESAFRSDTVTPRPAEPTDGAGRMTPGLAAAVSIVTQNGGTLGTETSPDGGTVIRVYLPRADAADRAAVPA